MIDNPMRPQPNARGYAGPAVECLARRRAWH